MSSYRNGTYVAFDGNGETNPTLSDQKYFQLLKAWNESEEIEFSFSDSHSKTYQVKDSSSLETLKSRLRTRMANSKNMLLIISENTNYDRGLLNWEIEEIVNVYKIPIIVAYVGYKSIQKPALLQNLWPKKLLDLISNGKAKCIHVPFKKDPILDAIGQFSVNSKFPSTSLDYYSDQAYRIWGLKR